MAFTQEYFEDLDKRSGTGYGGISTKIKMWITHKIIENELPQETTILEIGGAYGHLSQNLDINGRLVVNSDLSLYALKRSHHNVNALADAANLPFANESFNAAVSIDTFEHIPVELIPQALAEVNRVLRPGATFIFCPASLSDKRIYTDETHQTFYTPNQWLEVVQAAGFKLENSIYSKMMRFLGRFQPFGRIPLPVTRRSYFVLRKI